MIEIAGLVLPFFGLIFLGYCAARLSRQPPEALRWLNFLVVYVAPPALFFKLVSKTPIVQLTRVDFIFANILATYAIFALVFCIGLLIRESTVLSVGTVSFSLYAITSGLLPPDLFA